MIDDLDLLLLRHIEGRPFQSGREIARAVDVTEGTTRNRLNKLEKRGYLTHRTLGVWPVAYLWLVSALGGLLLRGAETK